MPHMETIIHSPNKSDSYKSRGFARDVLKVFPPKQKPQGCQQEVALAEALSPSQHAQLTSLHLANQSSCTTISVWASAAEQYWKQLNGLPAVLASALGTSASVVGPTTAAAAVSEGTTSFEEEGLPFETISSTGLSSATLGARTSSSVAVTVTSAASSMVDSPGLNSP